MAQFDSISVSVIVACSVAGAGCNQLLLTSSPTPAVDDSSDAGIATPVTRASHEVYFPIADGSNHAAQTCSDCHQSADSFADFTCISCHDHAPDLAATRHVHVTGFVYASSSCITCHPTGNEAAISAGDHSLKYFPINDAAHGSLQCSDCHQDLTTSKPFTCISCHDHSADAEATNHVNVPGYVYGSSSCLSCHTGLTN
jgi:hypothetical protein